MRLLTTLRRPGGFRPPFRPLLFIGLIWPVALFALCALFAACAPALDNDCRLSRDCHGNEVCLVGRCTLGTSHSTTGAGVEPPEGKADTAVPPRAYFDAGVAPPADSGSGPPTHPCSDARAPGPGDLVVNEILAAVPSGAEGDANGDGLRDAYDDEFLELVNVSGQALDMMSVRIHVDGQQRFRFEPLCLGAGEAVVIFGGGAPSLAPHVAVIVSETRLSLRNDGGRIEVNAREGQPIVASDYSGVGSGSEVLAPEVYGASYVPHASVAGGAPFSPGTCADGRRMTTGCVAPDAGGDDAGVADGG